MICTPGKNKNYILILLSIFIYFVPSSCGKIYFPLEMDTISRSERSEKQEKTKVTIIPMTKIAIKSANLDPYPRLLLDSKNRGKPAKKTLLKERLIENYPPETDPGPYLVGIGDVLKITFFGTPLVPSQSQTGVSFRLYVNEDGLINILQLGRVRAEGKTLSELEDLIYERLLQQEANTNFTLGIADFNSKQIVVYSDQGVIKSIPYTSVPIYLEQLLGEIITGKKELKITISREEEKFVVLYETLLSGKSAPLRLLPNDKILVETLNFKPEKVLIVGETGSQRAVSINSNIRPTLSDTLFSGSILNNITSDFSQIYVIREKNKKFKAYHLDISDPVRIHVASKFEMRPDDIIFVATQPLSLYSRALSQILGSTSATITARDQIRSEVR